jgi:hypothetical protein
MKHLLLINNAVTSDMVRKEEFQGAMHYMIKSATMPDDVVMNGGLYPTEEIEKSFMGLEEVHAPVGHPVSDNGDFISATNPFAVNNYGIGAQVVNVRRENGRVFHDTAINIEVAKRTDRGKRVLDRVEALVSGNNTHPIHTSTGIYLNREDVENDTTMFNNRMVAPHDWVGSEFFFDHNAILLDEEGAATPDQGTGMAVNKAGEQVKVLTFNAEEKIEYKEDEIVFSYAGNDKKGFLESLGSFIKSIGFASNNHDAYNGNTNNETPVEGIEMTEAELKAALDAQATALQANFKQSLTDVVSPLQESVKALEANAKAGEVAEKADLIAKSGLGAEIAETFNVNQLKAIVSKLETNEAGEFGERTGTELHGNKQDKKDDEWAGYDLNANMEAK